MRREWNQEEEKKKKKDVGMSHRLTVCDTRIHLPVTSESLSSPRRVRYVTRLSSRVSVGDELLHSRRETSRCGLSLACKSGR